MWNQKVLCRSSRLRYAFHQKEEKGWYFPYSSKFQIDKVFSLWISSLSPRQSFPGGASDKEKNLPASEGNIKDEGLTLGSGRSPGQGHGDPLQYSCLENPMDRGAWRAAAHRVTESQTGLSNWAHKHIP